MRRRSSIRVPAASGRHWRLASSQPRRPALHRDHRQRFLAFSRRSLDRPTSRSRCQSRSDAAHVTDRESCMTSCAASRTRKCCIRTDSTASAADLAMREPRHVRCTALTAWRRKRKPHAARHRSAAPVARRSIRQSTWPSTSSKELCAAIAVAAGARAARHRATRYDVPPLMVDRRSGAGAQDVCRMLGETMPCAAGDRRPLRPDEARTRVGGRARHDQSRLSYDGFHLTNDASKMRTRGEMINACSASSSPTSDCPRWLSRTR